MEEATATDCICHRVNLALGTAILTIELSVYGTICQRTLILHLMVLLSTQSLTGVILIKFCKVYFM